MLRAQRLSRSVAKVAAAGLFTKFPILELTIANLNGLKDNGHLVARRLQSPTQAVFFQETKLNNIKHLETFQLHLNNEVGVGKYKLFINDLRADRVDSLNNRRCGVASYFHESMPGFLDLQQLTNHDRPGRYTIVRTQWDGVPVYFHNVYAPVVAHSRAPFFEDLPRDFEDDSIHFVGGDFNLPLDEHLDATRPRQDHNAGKAECIAWLSALGVIDAWRMHHPNERVYSGPGRSNRLDYLFVDQDVVAQTYTRSSYSPSSFAGDHMEHKVVLSCEQRSPDRSYWRLPRELLKNPQVVVAIKAEANQLLEEMRADDTQNFGAKWYGWLKRMKKRLQVSHRQYNDSMKYTLNSLKMKWLTSRRAFDMGLVEASVVDTARQALDAARTEYRQFNLDQQFDFHANDNERGTSHFFRRPKGIKVPLSSVTINGVTSTDPSEVKAGFTSHWKNIMVTPRDRPPLNRARRRAIIRAIARRLTQEQREALDSPLTAEDLCGALKSMNPNKSPGPDGWPAAFFHVSPDIFAQILVKVFNYQLAHHGQLLLQQRRSAVALLFKAGDRGDPGNYRPIALMSVEVKILSRALAYRLAQVAPHLVHPSQVGFVPGRRLHDHVMLVQALQTFCTNEDHDYYATFLDFSKAYDMVDQGFLFDVLEEMNIGPTFVSWVQLLYNTPMVQIIFNDGLGPTIRPTRGVKQGCPLSCMLFVLYLEPLGEMLRGSPDYGIPLPNGDSLTSIYFADDTTLLSSSLQAAVEQMTIVDDFCSVSGARLNVSKCMTLALNNNLDIDDIDDGGLLNVMPSEKPVKYLGILFGHRLPRDFQVQQLNDKFLAAFQTWGSRARTLQGRKLIVSTMLLSLLWHATAAVYVPPTMVATWQRMVNKYILGRKTQLTDHHRPTICRKWQFDRKLGLGIPHVASKLRTQRLLRLQLLMQPDSPDAFAPWKMLVKRQFSRVMNKLHRETHPFDFLMYFPNHSSKWLFLWELHPLWHDIWHQWAATPMTERIASPPSIEMLLNLPVWLTSYPALQAGHAGATSNVVKTAVCRRWCRNASQQGFHCLKDFLTRQGTWPTKAAFFDRLSSNNRAAQVRLQPNGTMGFAAPERAGQVYSHLTKIFDQVLRTCSVRAGAALADIPTTSHPFKAPFKDQLLSFEHWPKRLVSRLAYHAPSDRKPHPVATSTRVEHQAIATYVKLIRKTCRWPPPLHSDVWFRLLFNMLPVNSRLFYLQPQQPDAICCVYTNCDAPENQHHAFHTCPRVYPLWRFHATAWRCFGVNFDWTTITNVDRFQVNEHGRQLQDTLFVLWALLCASNLHDIWTTHNAAKFESKEPPPPEIWPELSFIRWHASIRRWLRLQEVDSPQRVEAILALNTLHGQPPYRPLVHKYPTLLKLQPSATN